MLEPKGINSFQNGITQQFGKNHPFCSQKEADSSTKQDKIPVPAFLLGIGGLIPFVAGAAGVVSLPIAWGGYIAFLQVQMCRAFISQNR